MNTTHERVGWVDEPTGRGTWGLLVSCATTVFLSTYSAIHPNIPALDESEWKIWLRRIRYMLGCIIAPEIYPVISVHDLDCALSLKWRYKFTNPKSKKPWSVKQYHFVLMGGYVVQTSPTSLKRFRPEETIRFLQEGVVEMPVLEDRDIDDRSKANWVTKSIALLQICWFVLQLLGRAVQKLPITTLELYTLSIVVCAVFSYSFCWHRPFDVQRPVLLQARTTDYQWPEELKRVGLSYESNINTYPRRRYFRGIIIGAIFVLFSACHLLGWNFSFASATERWLWRAGSIGCCVLPVIISIILAIRDDLFQNSKPLMEALIISLSTLYVLVRFALFVEMLMGLRSLPAGVYQTPTWTDYFPSFGA